VSRRGFFAKVGAGGLTVAAVMFGRQGRAWAYDYGCCNLAISPPNVSFSQCINGGTGSIHVYAWGCSAWNPYPYVHFNCTCCENYYLLPNGYEDYVASAGSCSSTGP